MKAWLLPLGLTVVVSGILIALNSDQIIYTLSRLRSTPIAPTKIPQNNDSRASYVFPDLKMSFSYPAAWAGRDYTTKSENSLTCSYEASFLHNQYVTMCAVSLVNIKRCEEITPCVTQRVEQWQKDKSEIQLLPSGAVCSHDAISCTVVELPHHQSALLYYTGRYPKKVYAVYHDGYIIEFSFDIGDFCAQKYQDRKESDCVLSLQLGIATTETYVEVDSFDQMVRTLEFYD